MTPDEILNEILDDCADRNIATDGDKLLKALNDNGYAVIGAAELAALRAELAKVTLERDEAREALRLAGDWIENLQDTHGAIFGKDILKIIDAAIDGGRDE